MTDHVLRKCAHFAEYAVLGALTAAALRTSAHFSWPRALLPGPFAALCDETIQLFVPGRSGQITDVWLDTAGYLTGALLTLLLPFRISFYRRMGYGFAGKLYEYRLPTSVLPRPDAEAQRRLRLLRPEDFDAAFHPEEMA